jgi:hypothetical protein
MTGEPVKFTEEWQFNIAIAIRDKENSEMGGKVQEGGRTFAPTVRSASDQQHRH